MCIICRNALDRCNVKMWLLSCEPFENDTFDYLYWVISIKSAKTVIIKTW